MKIAIIGANGFIGTRLVESLVLEGTHQVRPLLHSPGSLARLSRFRIDDWRVTDALDSEAIARDLDGCDALVHGMIGHYDQIPLAARAAAEACAKSGTRMVYLSTASVHGQSPAPGTDERSPITAKQPLPYNAAKVRAEQALARVSGARVCVLRPGIVFGPRSIWTTNLARALREGSAYLVEGGPGICNSIYVDNLVAAIRLGLTHPRANEGPFYVSDADALTWHEFFRPIVEGLGHAMTDVHHVPRVAAPRAGIMDHVKHVRRFGLARAAFRRIPRRIKRAALGGMSAYSAGEPASGFALPRNKPPTAEFEMSELHTCRTRLPVTRAREVLGYVPPVSVHQGLERSLHFLRMTGAFPGDA